MPVTSIHSNNHVIHGFTGLEDYRNFIRLQSDNLSTANKATLDYVTDIYTVQYHLQNPKWYGENVTYEELTGHMTQFKDPALIERIYEQVKNRIPQSISNKLQEKKMRFNDMAGVFSMDRFMMAMYKRPAFWSVKKQAYVPPAEVYEKENQYFLRIDNSEVEKHEKLSTHNKQLFAYFPTINNDSKSIEIVMVAGANANIEADEMLYTGVTGILIAELCERAGIKVKINIIIGSISGVNSASAIVPMKQFNQTIDRNVIALLASDPRVFRYEMFKGIICNYNKFGLRTPDNLGRLVTEQKAREMFETNATLKKQVFATEKVFYTSGIFTEDKVFEKIDQILSQLT